MIDLAARAPVWEALADLYLDTDLVALGELGIARVARTLAGSPYSVEELRAIELWEVAPVVGYNLDIAVGGEWFGWDRTWLVRACAARARRRTWWLRQRVRFGYDRRVREGTEHYWAVLAPTIAGLRGGGGAADA